MTKLDCKVLTADNDITAIGDEWNQLHERVGCSPFADYDTLKAWWGLFGKNIPNCKLFVITGREAGRLVGVLAVIIVKRRGLRILRAAGHEAYPTDIVCENEAQAIELWQTARRLPGYDFASVRDVYPESKCYGALSSFAHKRDADEAYLLTLNWPNSEAWIASMPSRINHDPQRRLRRLKEKGEVKFHVYREGPFPKHIIEGMIKQKKLWANERDKRGMFDFNNVLEYFLALTENNAKKGRLFMSWLTCGDDVIAYDQGFIFNNILRNFTITHDPAWSWYSPGILILRNSIAWAIDNGIKEFNHGQGYGNYKGNYSNTPNHSDEFTFCNTTKGKLLESAFFSVRAVSRELRKRKAALKKKAKANA